MPSHASDPITFYITTYSDENDISIYKKDDSGKFYQFVNLQGEATKYYFEMESAKLVFKLNQLEEFPEWRNALKRLCKKWKMDDITTITSAMSIDPVEHEVLTTIMQDSLGKTMSNFAFDSPKAIVLFSTLKNSFMDLYPRRKKDILWRKIMVGKLEFQLNISMSWRI